MNKKLIKIVLLMVILGSSILGLAGCGEQTNNDNKDNSQVQESKDEGLKEYNGDTEDYTGYVTCTEMEGVEFKYPENYKSAGTSTQPAFQDQEIAGASVNIVSSAMPKGYSFENYIDASIKGVKSQMTINGEINKEYINLNGRKAAKLTYSATSQGITLQVTQVVIEKDAKAYILTMGGFESDSEALAPKIDKMIKSFK
ncbi:MAG: DUF1795 domain-containing protein [Clostridia bacterium]|jgi:hypothetical protein|nr:DUF1795 domain-containing protein [Clostridia bacterium]